MHKCHQDQIGYGSYFDMMPIAMCRSPNEARIANPTPLLSCCSLHLHLQIDHAALLSFNWGMISKSFCNINCNWEAMSAGTYPGNPKGYCWAELKTQKGNSGSVCSSPIWCQVLLSCFLVHTLVSPRLSSSFASCGEKTFCISIEQGCFV